MSHRTERRKVGILLKNLSKVLKRAREIGTNEDALMPLVKFLTLYSSGSEEVLKDLEKGLTVLVQMHESYLKTVFNIKD